MSMLMSIYKKHKINLKKTKMEPKTKEQIEHQIEKYLINCQQHLFVIEGGYLYKILTFKRNGKLYYTTIMIGNEKVMIKTYSAVNDNDYKYYGNNLPHSIKTRLFPEYYKTKSIPYFKKFAVLMDEIVPEIAVDNKINEEVGKDFIDRIKELELVK